MEGAGGREGAGRQGLEGEPILLIMELCLGGQRSKAREGGERQRLEELRASLGAAL